MRFIGKEEYEKQIFASMVRQLAESYGFRKAIISIRIDIINFVKIKEMDTKYAETLQQLLKFRDNRDWQQFHDSKNLALAISIEAAELNELFLWKEKPESENVNRDKLKDELADILSFAFLLANKHNLNPFEIINEKIQKNNQKYPVDKSKGKSDKYTEL